jgi:hypothetical protein
MAPNPPVFRIWPVAGSSRDQVEESLRQLDRQMQQIDRESESNRANSATKSNLDLETNNLNKEQIAYVSELQPVESNSGKVSSNAVTSTSPSQLASNATRSNVGQWNQTYQTVTSTVMPMMMLTIPMQPTPTAQLPVTSGKADDEIDEQVLQTMARRSHLPYMMLLLMMIMIGALFALLFFKCISRHLKKVWKSDKSRVSGLAVGAKLDLKTAQMLGQAYKAKVRGFPFKMRFQLMLCNSIQRNPFCSI